jgi:hypothetical protein
LEFLWPFGIKWKFKLYIFPRFGIFYQEKSGNPGLDSTFWERFGAREEWMKSVTSADLSADGVDDVVDLHQAANRLGRERDGRRRHLQIQISL